ncbi:MAG: metabolite traffic protein EboE [Planctomycetota bacterium]
MAEITLLAAGTRPARALHLTYCTNVHPGQSLADISRYLTNETAAIKKQVFPDRAMALGLRIGTQQAEELMGVAAPAGPFATVEAALLDDAIYDAPPTARLTQFAEELAAGGYYLWAVNAFPIQDFHAPRVKEQVYQPDWSRPERAASTIWIARAVAGLLGARGEGSLSVPTGVFKGEPGAQELTEACAQTIALTAAALAKLQRVTGKTVRLGLEPEPFTTAESLGDFKTYFETQLLPAGVARIVRHLAVSRDLAERIFRDLVGLNLDLCHQAIEFDDMPGALTMLHAAGIRVIGIHVSSALAIRDFSAATNALEYLRQFNEPRYLHQVVGRRKGSQALLHWPDLPDFFKFPQGFMEELDEIRVHFHVPIFCASMGPLGTTQPQILPALRRAAELDLCDTWMIETYTWNLLLKKGNSAIIQSSVGSVVEGIIEEFAWLKEQMPWR